MSSLQVLIFSNPSFLFPSAAVTCLFSLVCALVLAFFDKRAERILDKEEGRTGRNSTIRSRLIFCGVYSPLCQQHLSKYVCCFQSYHQQQQHRVCSCPVQCWFLAVLSLFWFCLFICRRSPFLFLYKCLTVQLGPPIDPELFLPWLSGEVIKLTDVKDFPLSLWFIFLICVGYYVAVFPFIGLGQWVQFHCQHTHAQFDIFPDGLTVFFESG